jgi:hypothetical protein
MVSTSDQNWKDLLQTQTLPEPPAHLEAKIMQTVHASPAYTPARTHTPAMRGISLNQWLIQSLLLSACVLFVILNKFYPGLPFIQEISMSTFIALFVHFVYCMLDPIQSFLIEKLVSRRKLSH